ncbi:Aminopeptidase [Trichostrongylus colubriformis]|uniref:Aminopeptidase n=1 Tax=Trichostrongylus colubriformis TaxID=6319 RepID=A0AAN8ILL0_TRICO
MSSSDEDLSHISIEFGEQDSKEAQKRKVAFRLGFCAVVLVAISFVVLIVATSIGWVKTFSFFENLFGTSIPDHILRLPDYVRPLTYNLKMKVYLPSYPDVPPEKEMTFDGEVDILVEVLAPTNLIILHMLDIAIKNVHVSMNGEDIFVKHKSIERMEVGVFLLSSTIPADQHIRVKVIYTGVIQNDRLGGLYKTSYKDIDGSLKIAAVTHFEPSHARRMVPCFDEPAFKAKWTVTIIHPERTTAISNAKEIDTIRETNLPWRTTSFEETPKMSTYILAIAVSEFKFVEGHTKADVRVRVWSRPAALNRTSKDLPTGIWFLDFYNSHFGIKYPLPKLDMVAVPDFSAGAMENWGLNTYIESVLWSDSQFSGTVTVAHELAHQWFGNLVTCMWWNDIWLNEGFATYMSFEAMKPLTKLFLTDVIENALEADSVATSHPLSFKIDRPVEVVEGFDTVTYFKGACLLGMIAALMGEENFNKGIKRYLMKFSYGNARSQDLFDVLDTVTTQLEGPDGNNLSVKRFANQWTMQMGFPLVTVEAVNSSLFKITQSRYKKNPNAVEVEKYRNPEYGFKWEVPIWYQLDDEPVKLAWLRRDSPLHIFANTERSTLVVNAERRGFYRQNYDEKGWRKITQQLISNHKIYSKDTKEAIIYDAFAAAAINRLNYTTVLRLLEHLERKKEYFWLQAASAGLRHIRRHIYTEKGLVSFQRYVRKLLGTHPLEASSFWMKPTGENCKAEDAEECSAKYVKIFEEGVLSKCESGTRASSCVELPIPERSAAYCYGIKELGNQAYDTVMELLRMETVPDERERLISALGCHKDISVLRSTLELATNREQFRLQEISGVFEAVASYSVSSGLVFNFLLENWNKIYGR